MTPDLTHSDGPPAMPTLPAPWPDLSRQCNSPHPVILEHLALQLHRSAGEGRLESCQVQRDQHGWLVFGAPQLTRYLLENGDQAFSVHPLLPDRPVVSRPAMPIELLPRQRATLLIGSPLWLEVRLGEDILVQLPIERLSDTWFGPNTRSGELAYANQTKARLQLEQLSDNPFKAYSAVTIVNLGGDPLKLERINLPMPNLTLFCDGQRFWTSALTITRERDLATASLEIGERPPCDGESAWLVAEPRKPVRGGVFSKALDLLFA